MHKRAFFLFFVFFAWGCRVAIASAEEEDAPVRLFVSAIIEVYEEGKSQGIILVHQGKDISLPGGEPAPGETIEQTLRTSCRDQTNSIMESLRQFTLSYPPESERMEIVYSAQSFRPPCGDGQAFVVALDNIPWKSLSFDHAAILREFIKGKNCESALYP